MLITLDPRSKLGGAAGMGSGSSPIAMLARKVSRARSLAVRDPARGRRCGDELALLVVLQCRLWYCCCCWWVVQALALPFVDEEGEGGREE